MVKKSVNPVGKATNIKAKTGRKRPVSLMKKTSKTRIKQKPKKFLLNNAKKSSLISYLGPLYRAYLSLKYNGGIIITVPVPPSWSEIREIARIKLQHKKTVSLANGTIIRPIKRQKKIYSTLYKKLPKQWKKKLKKWNKKYRLLDIMALPGKIIRPVLASTFVRRAFTVLLSVGAVSFVLLYIFVIRTLPNPKNLSLVKSPMTTIIRDRNDRVLYRVYKDANRVWLSWEEIPDIVKKATLAIEDTAFYKHHGVSFKSIIRALVYNMKQENIKQYQGGSTLTQQLVKNKFLSADKSIERKVKEAILSLWTELLYNKQEIFTMYLNEVGYGGPAYGIEAASQMYFGIPAKNLSLAQAAFLAGLPAAPTTFSPFGANSELSTDRQKQVLERMYKLKMISKNDYQKALDEKLVFAPQKIDIEAPHWVMYIKSKLADKLGENAVNQGGLDVVTTLDLDIQNKAQEAVTNQVKSLEKAYNIHNGAAIVTNPRNGEILAMVGSVDYFNIDNKGYVNATTALRQPGSSIKPLNYAYALDHGYSPTSIIDDSPVVYTSKGSKERYAPQNYDGKFHGNVTLRSALACSYNIPAVKVLNSYGVDKMIDLGRKTGIRSWNNLPPIGLSLTLGGAEVTMLDMTRLYGTIANNGKKQELRDIVRIRNSQDEDLTSMYYNSKGNTSLIEEAQASDKENISAENEQVISPLAAYWLTDIMSDNNARLPAFGPYAKLTVPGHKVAVKTGTTNDYRDNWTIGFSPDYLTAVWVGNNDGSFMNKHLVSGITGAAPIWNEIMTNLLANVPDKDFTKPDGLIPVKICAVNGLLTCPNCPVEKTEYFTVDKVPTKKCYFKSASECDAIRGQLEGKSEEEKKQMLSGCPAVSAAPAKTQ